MAEGRAAEREDRRPDLHVGDDLDAEDVGEARAAVVPEGAEDEVLAFLVEDEDAGEHGGEGAGGNAAELEDDGGVSRWQYGEMGVEVQTAGTGGELLSQGKFCRGASKAVRVVGLVPRHVTPLFSISLVSGFI